MLKGNNIHIYFWELEKDFCKVRLGFLNCHKKCRPLCAEWDWTEMILSPGSTDWLGWSYNECCIFFSTEPDHPVIIQLSLSLYSGVGRSPEPRCLVYMFLWGALVITTVISSYQVNSLFTYYWMSESTLPKMHSVNSRDRGTLCVFCHINSLECQAKHFLQYELF